MQFVLRGVLNYNLSGRCRYVGATIGRPSAIRNACGKPMVSPTNTQFNLCNNYELSITHYELDKPSIYSSLLIRDIILTTIKSANPVKSKIPPLVKKFSIVTKYKVN